MYDNQITEKQSIFLNTLIAERDPDANDVRAVSTMMKLGILDKKGASACIELLLKLPKTVAPAIPTIQTPEPLKIGIYDTMPGTEEFVTGRFLIAYTNKYGSISVKRLYKSWSTKSGYSWTKSSTYILKNLLKMGTVHVDSATVGALGKKFGMCMYCGHLLTDPASIAEGVGPVCKSKYC